MKTKRSDDPKWPWIVPVMVSFDGSNDSTVAEVSQKSLKTDEQDKLITTGKNTLTKVPGMQHVLEKLTNQLMKIS